MLCPGIEVLLVFGVVFPQTVKLQAVMMLGRDTMHAPSSPVTLMRALMQLNLKNLRLACGVFFGDEDMVGLGEQRQRQEADVQL